MNNADKFKQIFDLYATELWAMSEKDFLAWLNAESDASDTNSNDMEELKPCPFCGGSDIDIRTDDGGLSWYSFCNDCGVICGYSMTKDDTVNAWNMRTDRIEND